MRIKTSTIENRATTTTDVAAEPLRLKMNPILVALAKTATKPSVETFAPILAGQKPIEHGVRDLINERTPVRDKVGRIVGYKMRANSALWQAPWCFTTLAMELYAAQKMGLIGYAQGVGALNDLDQVLNAVSAVIHTEMEFLRAPTDNRAIEVPPGIVVHARLRSKHSVGEGTSADYHAELEALIADQHADNQFQAAGLAYDAHEELQHDRWEKEAGNNGVRNSSGGTSEDEGWLEVALHEPKQLWDYRPSDIAGMRGLMTKVLVRLKGLKLPMEHPMYEALLNRLTEAWAATAGYFEQQAVAELRREGNKFPSKQQIKERVEKMTAAHKLKCAKRALILTEGLLAEPTEEMRMAVGTYDRWAVNHATRRMWRDMETIKKLKDRLETQIGDVLAKQMEEERYNKPNPTWARSIANEEAQQKNEGQDDRTWYLAGWAEVTEKECLVSTKQGHGTGYGAVVTTQRWSVDGLGQGETWTKEDINDDVTWDEIYEGPDGRKRSARRSIGSWQTAGEREVAILRRVIERCDEVLVNVGSLYKEFRALDLALAPVWAALHVPEEELEKGQPLMPAHPPVYWNMAGEFQTEEEACEAMLAEVGQRDFEALEASGDRAMGRIRALLAGSKFDR